MIHSVDSFHLAKEIDKRAGQAGITMDVLIQVDPADQETKFGVDPSDLDPLIRQISEECPNVRVKGLMCIAPFCEDPEDTRPFFREVKTIYDRCCEKYEGLDNVDFQYLSMGMTNDFRIAVEEGSNLVRVGTAIFGYRDYRKEEK
jgi:pyridoxal phosphate enzyme (YggS family)